MKKRSGMGGRGIQAMLGAKQKSEISQNEQRIERLSVRQIQPGQYQPRQNFSGEALQELAESIQAQGLVQPIVVREVEEDKYEIIAGERRWRATKLAGLEKIPAIIRKADSQTTLAMALIENIQREDLNPMETAIGLRRLLDEFDLTQQSVAEAVGRSRSAVSNLLRLLKLPESIQNALNEGVISMGHARCIINFPESIQTQLVQDAVSNQWSVRQMEQAAQHYLTNQPDKTQKAKKPAETMQWVVDHQNFLSNRFSSEVKIQHKAGGKGRIEIRYKNEEELQAIIQSLK